MKIIIIIYCFLSLFHGIGCVKTVLMGDIEEIKNKKREYGRVELGCSYWYEYYEPRELIKAWRRGSSLPILFPLIDRAASPIYWKKYSKGGE